ncbi:hypothetical protein DWX58_01590 [Pseudoflavonifractor sp. AF19-9AC]|uniref:InlB B-repeat-containing protein n=1 Tax=Pseudoflavonifractor sp. AF19-9AC TaxID=2292244 RepID=UPI000E499C2B|nr:InlB B-repeat-containing protein [Pseudoflavonifractor sp. AF19-9AC]RHR11174.1 hypothetical protein DWX58_01590 [Pseudoflavonifractor sp. AF19-9AC]
MQSNLRKRIGSALLAVVLLLGLLPATAWAEDPWQEVSDSTALTLTEALKNGGNIRVTASTNVATTETVNITKPVVLDLNGQTVTWKSSAKEIIKIQNGGSLIIQDSKTNGTLNFTNTYDGTSNSGIYLYTGGSLTINSGTVTYCHDSKSGRAIYTLGSGAFAMNGGTVKISGATSHALYLSGTAPSEITGGRIVLDGQLSASMVYGLCAYGSGAVNITGLEVDGSNVPEIKTVYCVYGANNHISGGTYKTNSRNTSYAVSGPSSKNTSSISGGTFNGAVKAAAGKITGGMFSKQPSVDYLSEGKIYERKDDGYYHVVDGTYVACIDGVGYTSWDDLFFDVPANSSSAKIVDVMSDSDMITIPAEKNVTFRSTADYKIGKVVNNGSLRVISQMTDTVIENHGTLSLAHEVGSIVNAENASVTVTDSNAKVTDSIVNSGTLNIASGTYPCDIQNSGALNITGGTFQGSVTSTTETNITGGTFSADIKDLCASGYTTRKNREGTWEVVTDDRVAQNGEYWYSSLADALKDVRTGETVTLLKDASLKNEITITDKNITIDTNGRTITYTGERFYRYAVINLSGTSNVVVTGNGTFTFDPDYVTYNTIGYIFSLAGNSRLTIENGTYHAGFTCVQLEESAVAYIKDGIFSTDSDLGLYDEKYWALNRVDNSDTKFYVYGGTFENYDPSNSVTESPAENFCADGYKVTSREEGGKTYYTVEPDETATFAAEVDGLKYISISAAMDAAADGDTVTLLSKYEGEEVVTVSKAITVDLAETGTSFDKFVPAEAYQMTTDGTKLVFALKTFTVTFNSNGGSAVASQTVTYNTVATEPAAPTRSGYTFDGWYSDEGLTTVYDFSAPVTSDITLYAKWTYIGGGSSSGGSGSSGNKTETVTNPDGSTTTTVTKPDGTVTETTTDKAGNKTEVVEKPDGSSKTTVTNKDGSSSTTTVSKDGQVEAEVKLPTTVVDNAQEEGESVVLPMPEVPVTTDEDDAPTVTVDLPAGRSARVLIPVDDVTPGTVAILVHENGTKEIAKTSITTEEGVVVTLSDGDTVKIMDNSIDFVDVPDSYWGSAFVDFVTSRGLFAGTSATTFSPDLPMTRAMIVTVLAAYDGVDTTAPVGDHWYSAGQQWAMKKGVSDGTNMEGVLTREQLAVMLWSYASRPEASISLNGYSDAGSVSAWAVDAMTWAVENGLISGSDKGELLPRGQATRVQVATILMHFVEVINR